MANKDKKIEGLDVAIKTAANSAMGIKTAQEDLNQQPLASIRTARTDGTVTKRTGQYSGGGQNSTIGPPSFYAPWLTASSWQIPNNRKEVYLWAQWWVDNEPKVAAGIEFYTDFPLSGFTLECANAYVKDYFEKLNRKLKITKKTPQISQEYHLRGDCFVLASIECETCGGLNINPDTGEQCNHEGASWKNLSVLNPDHIEVHPAMLDQEPEYFYIPDDMMKKVVQEKKPEKLYNSMMPEMRKLIQSGQPIHFSQECIYHFKRGGMPWQPFGTSLLRRLFQTLAYKDKIRQANWLVAERHIIPVKIVKVGDKDRPATEEDLMQAQDELTSLANDPLLTIVTHHAFEFDYVGASGKILQLSQEYENINQDIIDGLMLNKAIINGEGPSYSNAQVGLLTMAKRLERFREEVAFWMEEHLYKPVAIWNGFTTEGKRGQIEYVYPTVKWDDLQLRDDTGKLQTLLAANQAGIVSNQSVVEALGLPYDQEVERLRFEQGSSFISSPDLMNTDITNGFGGMGTGFRGALPGMPGGPNISTPESPTSPLGSPDMGGMPGLAPAASTDWEGNYRFASCVSGDIYDVQLASCENEKIIRTASKKIISSAHRAYLESIAPVTGRGMVGPIPMESEGILEQLAIGPADGGPFCTPMNRLAIYQLQELDKSLGGDAMTRIAAKKGDTKQTYRFTSLEQKLYKILMQAGLPLAWYAQYLAGPSLEYQLDAAIPAIKLGLEADGEIYHNNPEKIAKDRKRDSLLATQGWTVLRFTESELNEHSEEVLKVIMQTIRRLLGAGQHMGSSVYI
jgi:very-short-patch-repair endonuclease